MATETLTATTNSVTKAGERIVFAYQYGSQAGAYDTSTAVLKAGGVTQDVVFSVSFERDYAVVRIGAGCEVPAGSLTLSVSYARPGSDLTMVSITQAAYDALPSKDTNTLYVIVPGVKLGGTDVDGYYFGTTSVSALYLGGNLGTGTPIDSSAPVCTVAPSIIDATPTQGDVITSASYSRGTWSGYPAPTYSFQVLVNNVATALPYTVATGDVLKVSVTASNSAGTTTAVSDPTAAAVALPVAGGGGGTQTAGTYATLANTGPASGTTFTVHAGDWTITTPGTVIDGYEIQGVVFINANNVEIRNCKIHADGNIVQIPKGVTGAWVHHCEIYGNGAGYSAILGCGKFEYNQIHDIENGITISGWVFTEVRGNHIDRFYSPGRPGGHKDGIECYGEDGGTGYMSALVEWNTVIMDATDWPNTCGWASNTFGPVRDTIFRNNYFDARNNGGSSMYYGHSNYLNTPLTGITYKDNYLGKGYEGYIKDFQLLYPNSAMAPLNNVGNVLAATAVPVEQAPWIIDGVQMVQAGSAGGGDTTAPTITSASTASVTSGNAFSMDLTASETVTWSKIGGADAALFTLSGSTLSMAAKSFGSPTDADANNTYIVTVRATDGSGNTTDKTITVTVTAAATATSLWDSSTTPPTFEHNDSGGITITQGTQLYFTQAGTVSAIKFYWANQTSAASPSGIVGLYDSAGTLLGSANYSGLTGAAGWQTITLTTPVSVSANTKYIATMYQPRGTDSRFHYGYGTSFGSSAHTSTDGKIVAPANGSTANSVTYQNGVYSYNSSAAMVLPVNTFNNEGYYVDVVYTPS